MEVNRVAGATQAAPQVGRPLSEAIVDWLPLSLEAMGDLGPAAQTLGAFWRVSSGKPTFISLERLARVAVLPRRTVFRHVHKIVAHGWLVPDDPQPGYRTRTYRMPPTARRRAIEKFGRLPRWAASILPTWAERAVFALVASRCAMIDRLEEMQETHELYDRHRYSLNEMARDAGIARSTIQVAKQALLITPMMESRGLISIDPYEYHHDDGDHIYLAESMVDEQLIRRFLDDDAIPHRKPS